MAVLSVVTPGGNGQAGSGVGWVLYPPLSVNEGGMSMDFAIFAVHVSGASSILGAINMITTFLNMRAPGMTLHKSRCSAWSIFVTAWLILLGPACLAGAITMLLTDRNFGTTFFDPLGGGDPILYQHILWFFGHPEVTCHRCLRFGIISTVSCNLLEETNLRLPADGLGDGCNWRARLRCLGTPHVHGGYVPDTAILLHAGDNGHCGSNRGKNLLMDRNHVGRLN